MAPPIVGEWNASAVVERDAIELEHSDTLADPAWVLDSDVVLRRAITQCHGEPGPSRGDAWVDRQSGAPHSDAEKPLDPGAIQPALRSGVPGPPATADVRRLGID